MQQKLCYERYLLGEREREGFKSAPYLMYSKLNSFPSEYKTHSFQQPFLGLAFKCSGINLIQECDLTSIEFTILRYSLSPPQITPLPLQITAKQYFRSLSTITLGVTLANNEQMMGGCGSDPQQVIWSASETIGPTLDHLTTQHRNSCQSTTDHLTTLETQQRNPCQQKNKSSTHPGPRILYIKCRVWKITIKTSLTKRNVNILFYINSCPSVCLNVTLF